MINSCNTKVVFNIRPLHISPLPPTPFIGRFAQALFTHPSKFTFVRLYAEGLLATVYGNLFFFLYSCSTQKCILFLQSYQLYWFYSCCDYFLILIYVLLSFVDFPLRWLLLNLTTCFTMRVYFTIALKKLFGIQDIQIYHYFEDFPKQACRIGLHKTKWHLLYAKC